jgi:hypothetical protein
MTYFILHNQLLSSLDYPVNPNDILSNLLRRNTLVLDLASGEIIARRYSRVPALSGWDVRLAHSSYASFFHNEDLALLLDILPDPVLAHELLCRDEGRFRQGVKRIFTPE